MGVTTRFPLHSVNVSAARRVGSDGWGGVVSALMAGVDCVRVCNHALGLDWLLLPCLCRSFQRCVASTTASTASTVPRSCSGRPPSCSTPKAATRSRRSTSRGCSRRKRKTTATSSSTTTSHWQPAAAGQARTRINRHRRSRPLAAASAAAAAACPCPP